MASQHIVVTSDATFQQDVLDSELPVLVDFWCGPCKAIAPLLDQIADEKVGRLRIAKLDVDQNRRTAMQFGVSSIPTLLVFKGGKLVTKKIGAGGGKAALESLVAPHL
jgi:thioredoxin 1